MTELMQLVLAGLGLFMSWLVGNVPVVVEWFYNIDKKWRGLVNAGLALGVAGAIFGLSCTGMFDFVKCTQADAFGLLKAWGLLFATNQLTYLALPESKLVTAIKARQALAVK
jgi:hypothetical protein